MSDRKWDEGGPDVDRADASQAHDRAEKAAHHNDAGADDYAVGYGRPPKATRFQPGKSGNPAGGRKRKAPGKSFAEVLKEQLAETVQVTIGGRKKRITRFEALARSVIGDALKGNDRARRLVFNLISAFETRDRATDNPFISPNGKVHEFNWNEEQKELYRELEKEYRDTLGE